MHLLSRDSYLYYTFYQKYNNIIVLKGDVFVKLLILSDLHYVGHNDWLDFIDKYGKSDEFDILVTLGDIDHMYMGMIERNFKHIKIGVLKRGGSIK